jgi:hypothetical protein
MGTTVQKKVAVVNVAETEKAARSADLPPEATVSELTEHTGRKRARIGTDL